MLEQTPLHDNVSFRIAAATVGPNGRLTLPHLIRMFQEAAMQNTVRLKVSSPELMADLNLSWVLRRQRIEVQRWPAMGEAVRVLTAPTGFARGLLTYRDFHLVTNDGQPLATGASEWLLIDMTRRRPQPIPPRIASLSTSLAPASAHLERPAGKIKPPAQIAARTESTVAYHQLDFNDHLTNPVFPELMLEPLGHQFLSTHEPNLADISFQYEARYGAQLTATVGEPQEGFRQHGLYEGEKLLATMQTNWAPRQP